MRSVKMAVAAVAAASVLMVVWAGSASAANWDPPNQTLTASGTLTLDQGIQNIMCNYHSGVRSAGGADAFTTEPGSAVPAGPTFSNCNTNLGDFAVHVTSTSAWTLTATNTTAVDVTNLNVTIVITSSTTSGTPICTIHASGVSLGATWNNVAKTLVPGAGGFNVTQNDVLCAGGTGVKVMQMTGSISIPGANLT